MTIDQKLNDGKINLITNLGQVLKEWVENDVVYQLIQTLDYNKVPSGAIKVAGNRAIEGTFSINDDHWNMYFEHESNGRRSFVVSTSPGMKSVIVYDSLDAEFGAQVIASMRNSCYRH